jgi:DNA polymerase-3 subunit delta
VERYYGGRVETSAFTVADTAIAGRYGDALVALRHALASGADPVPLVAAIASKLRTMARVAGAIAVSATVNALVSTRPP